MWHTRRHSPSPVSTMQRTHGCNRYNGKYWSSWLEHWRCSSSMHHTCIKRGMSPISPASLPQVLNPGLRPTSLQDSSSLTDLFSSVPFGSPHLTEVLTPRAQNNPSQVLFLVSQTPASMTAHIGSWGPDPSETKITHPQSLFLESQALLCIKWPWKSVHCSEVSSGKGEPRPHLIPTWSISCSQIYLGIILMSTATEEW